MSSFAVLADLILINRDPVDDYAAMFEIIFVFASCDLPVSVFFYKDEQAMPLFSWLEAAREEFNASKRAPVDGLGDEDGAAADGDPYKQ